MSEKNDVRNCVVVIHHRRHPWHRRRRGLQEVTMPRSRLAPT